MTPRILVLSASVGLLDQPSSSGKNRTGRLRLAVEKLNLRKFIRRVRFSLTAKCRGLELSVLGRTLEE